MFDIEWPKNHPNLKQAIRLAQEHGIRLAISNPCFELWLILHFEDQTAFIGTKEAESRSRKLDGRSGKRIDPNQYMPRRHEAVRRALLLAQRHARHQSSCPDDNPSSAMGELLAAIQGLDRTVR
uniref:RloB n=1 Tax=Nonomuraea gerenzanensis TaxID=93944 RepID=A0A1M4E166_9ACTN|nr:hypothetical protein BN4615_P2065 [Nonomuraea gerenzanensis]